VGGGGGDGCGWWGREDAFAQLPQRPPAEPTAWAIQRMRIVIFGGLPQAEKNWRFQESLKGTHATPTNKGRAHACRLLAVLGSTQQ
jgi:hypothetical protein